MTMAFYRRKECFVAFVATVLFSVPPVQAGTTVQGTVKGEWTPSGSPYQVVGDATVEAGDTLWIDSGVTVEFSQSCNLKVYGTLIAAGLDLEPVVFKGAQNQPGYWGSIYFIGASSGCLISGAQISDASTGVVASACSLEVLNTTFVSNITGMDCKSGANPRIEGNTFTHNTNSALRIQDASPWVVQCTFTYNALGDLQPTLTVTGTGVPHIQRCVIRDNGDVAVQVDNADSAVVANNSIVDNPTGIVVSNSSCLVSSNIVANNDMGIAVYTPRTVQVRYNDVWHNTTADYDGDVGSLGANSTVNARGDSCDPWMNISENPQFLWPDSTDLTLSAASPCIDVGDPDNPGDMSILGDGPDIGAFEHDPNDHRLPVELTFLHWVEGELLWQTASETDNLGFEIQYSPDGNVWTRLGFVRGAGTTTRPHTYSYPAPRSGFYRLVQIDMDGSRHVSLEIQTGTPEIPLEAQLATFPNPANPHVTIEVTVPNDAKGQVEIAIFDVTGRRVALLHRGPLAPGAHQFRWDGTDDAGRPLASGTYTVVLHHGQKQISRKITLLR